MSKENDVGVGIYTKVNDDTHSALIKLSENRKMSLRLLTRELLAWASTQDAKTLIKLGVNLPMWSEDK